MKMKKIKDFFDTIVMFILKALRGGKASLR